MITSTVGRDEASAIGISQDGRTALVWGSDGPRIWKPLSGRQFRFDQAIGAGFANSDVEPEALSADGNVVMFGTDATNLVRRDTNHAFDVFIRNVRTGHTRRVSVGGVRRHRQANGYSVGLALSQHGEYRLFWSAATNLVSGDRNAKIDIFLRSAPTRRCNVSTAGDRRGLAARGSLRSRLTAPTSHSDRAPPTSFPTTPTARRTSSLEVLAVDERAVRRSQLQNRPRPHQPRRRRGSAG